MKSSLTEEYEKYYRYYLEDKRRDLVVSIICWTVAILLTGGIIFLMFKYLDILTIFGVGIISPFALMILASIFFDR